MHASFIKDTNIRSSAKNLITEEKYKNICVLHMTG